MYISYAIVYIILEQSLKKATVQLQIESCDILTANDGEILR